MNDSGKARTRARKDRKPYTEKGYFTGARIWLGGDMARTPGAFTLYLHLVGWANHKGGTLRRGQLALGEFDLAQRLGWSHLTVRKWLRWLRDRGWIELEPKRHGATRGSIVTVVHYESSQDRMTYKNTTTEDQKMILTPEGSEDQKMILTRLSEDQKMILKPPCEDQKMIPHIFNTHSYTGAAQRHRASKSAGGDKGCSESGGLALPGKTIASKALTEVEAMVTAAAAKAALERKRPVGKTGRGRTGSSGDHEGPKPLEGATPL